MKVVWSRLAIKRAYEEARFIAEDKPEAALQWLDALFDSTDRLATFPESGAIVPELALPEFRQLLFRSHRVIYRVEAKRVAILTVRRTNRRLDISELH
jgi:plasmid stabilization system protein ParE